MKRIVCVAAAGLLVAGTARAVPVDWADWTDGGSSGALGSVGGIDVFFQGDPHFLQLGFGNQFQIGPINASGTTNYWTEPDPARAPYTGNPVVDNAPTAYELLGFVEASSNLIEFESPVVDPVMAIVSQGSGAVPVVYDFDTPFDVLSEGLGFWGDGSFSVDAGTDELTGRELHAVIRFQGTVSQIQWTSTREQWHGVTIGIPRYAVPEPATLALLALGLSGAGWARPGRAARPQGA